jgi:hypothetical protein
MNGINRYSYRAAATLACLVASASYARELAVEKLLEDLDDPRGVAVRAGDAADPYEVFVADAGRIVKIGRGEKGNGTNAITGFVAELGPRALLFLDRDHLVVGGAAHPTVRLYELSDQPLLAADTKQVIDDPMATSTYALARTRQNDKVPDLVILSGTNRKWPVGLARIPIRAGTLDKMSPLVDESQLKDSSRALAVSEQGFVAACLHNQSGERPQTALVFFDLSRNTEVATFPITLQDVIALAYNPANHNLYAIDGGSSSGDSGVFRLDDVSEPGKPACDIVKIATLEKPTALTFADDGTLYVTTANAAKQGTLLRITGDL